jgi:hypothetical protein
MTMPLCTKRCPYKNGLPRLVLNNLIGLHRALTSTPSNTFGMDWNFDCEPGLTSVLDLTNGGALVEASPHSNVTTSSWKPSQKSGGCYSGKGGTNSIILHMILEWDVWRAGDRISCLSSNIQCIQKVFRPLDFSHILLRYSLILKLIKYCFPPHQSTHNTS